MRLRKTAEDISALKTENGLRFVFNDSKFRGEIKKLYGK